MSCCGGSHTAYASTVNDEDPCAKEHPDKGKYEGMNPVRSTTDILMFIAIVCMWIAMTVVGAKAIEGGDPYLLIAPVDDMGKACGYDTGVGNKPNFYAVMQNTLGICVDKCPATSAMTNSTDADDYYCLDFVHQLAANKYILQTYISTKCMTNGEYDITTDCGCNLKLQAESTFHRCIFTDKAVRQQFTSYYAKYTDNFFTQFIQDIYTAIYVIFCFGILLTFALCLIWCYLMHFKIVGMVLTWGSLAIVLMAMIAFCGLAQKTSQNWKAEDPPQHSYREIKSLEVVSIALLVITVVYICFMVFMRNSINLAVSTVALTARCIDDMPIIVLVPVFNLLGFMLFLAPWIVYIFYQASMGKYTTIYQTNPVTGTQYAVGKTYSVEQDVEDRLWFLYFCLLWTMNFCAAFGSIVIALACSKWYFTSPEDKKNHIGEGSVLEAYWYGLRYHLGTVAFGSLIIAIIQFVRSIVLYIEKNSQEVKKNPAFKWIFKCVDCCLWCFEKCMKFINKNAYIQTAIHSHSFIFAAKNAFFTIARNILRIGAVHVVSGICLMIGKVSVMALTSLCAYFFFQGQYGEKLHGFVAPTLMVAILSYIISSMFMEVFEMGVDTLLMCYITDEENNGVAKFAEAEFNSFVETNGKLDAPPPAVTDATSDSKAVATL